LKYINKKVTEAELLELREKDNKKLSKRKYKEFEDMVYYITHVMNHPESYAEHDLERAVDLLAVITHDVLEIQKGDNGRPLKTAGYKTLAAISNEVN
jgi:hypothetical protein